MTRFYYLTSPNSSIVISPGTQTPGTYEREDAIGSPAFLQALLSHQKKNSVMASTDAQAG